AGRTVTSMAVWISPLVGALKDGAEIVAQLVARGIVEGHYDPQSIYREGYSDHPPKLDMLTLVATDTETAALVKAAEKGVIVGEGVCFDSGGISIKPSDRMDEMKMDKTGAATVIAAAVTTARIAPGTPLLAVAPMVENMPGPHSTRPGDVVKALNGKMVDI